MIVGKTHLVQWYEDRFIFPQVNQDNSITVGFDLLIQVGDIINKHYSFPIN